MQSVFYHPLKVEILPSKINVTGFPGGSTVRNLPAVLELWVQSLGQENSLGQEKSLGQGNSLEEGRATHSSILAEKIPWIEEPGGLRSMGLQRVGHD